MGCCVSSPYTRRRYRDPGDLDEDYLPLRTFGGFRPGASVHVPDDVDGLFSTHILRDDDHRHLASDTGPILYEAELDLGYGFRCCRPLFCCCFFVPHCWVILARALLTCNFSFLSCDEVRCNLAAAVFQRACTLTHVYLIHCASAGLLLRTQRVRHAFVLPCLRKSH